MKVIINPELCEGHGTCEEQAPKLFVLGEDDKARLRVDPVPAEAREAVEQAVRSCPRHAIRIEED